VLKHLQHGLAVVIESLNGAGGITSDFLGRQVGMKGRLGLLFTCQMIGAVMCVLLGINAVAGKLSHTVAVILVFSFFIEVIQYDLALDQITIPGEQLVHLVAKNCRGILVIPCRLPVEPYMEFILL
jgi:hypothetical protein